MVAKTTMKINDSGMGNGIYLPMPPMKPIFFKYLTTSTAMMKSE